MIGETREKKQVKTNSIIIENGGNEQIVYYAPEIPQFFAAMTKEWHCVFDAFFFTRILKIDKQRFLYIDRSICTFKFLKFGRDK